MSLVRCGCHTDGSHEDSARGWLGPPEQPAGRILGQKCWPAHRKRLSLHEAPQNLKVTPGAFPLTDKRIMEEQIVVGDVVRFKGGGSPMTVEKIEGDEAICVFSLGGKQRLKLEVLEKVPDEKHWWDRG